MAKITPAQVRACYEAALQVRSGKVTPTLAVKLVEAGSGMTFGSALDYIYNAQHLIRGEPYTRTMNPQGTASLLQWIGEDFGVDVAKRAAQAVVAHVAYYQQLPRSGPQTAVRQAAEAVLAPGFAASPAILQIESSDGVARSLSSTPDARAARLAAADPKPKTRTVLVTVYDRNPDVVAEVLLRAKGTCEHCSAAAPFNRLTNGQPYLEVHHRIPLAQGGFDTVANAIALCPNCHREAHCGIDRGKFTSLTPKG